MQWIEGFLSDRRQRVVIKGSLPHLVSKLPAGNLVSKLPPIRGKFDFNFVCNFYKDKCENSDSDSD